MSKTTLFTGVKTALEAISGIKHVALWNEQPAHEREENPFLYPAVFIEFLPSEYRDLSQGVQEYDLTVRLHICFESYLDEDITILGLVESVFSAIHFQQYGYFGRLLRRNEEQNFDHTNVQDYMQDYGTLGRDFIADQRPTAEHTVTDEITPEIVTKAELG